MIIDLWVNALSKDAAAAFLGKSGFGSVEGFFGVDIREGMTPLDLVAEMDRVGVDRAVLSSTLSSVDDKVLAFVAEHLPDRGAEHRCAGPEHLAVRGRRRHPGVRRRATRPAVSGRFGRSPQPAQAAEYGRTPAGG